MRFFIGLILIAALAPTQVVAEEALQADFLKKLTTLNPAADFYNKTETVRLEADIEEGSDGESRPSVALGKNDVRVRYRTPGIPDTNPRLGGKPVIYVDPDAPPSFACGIEAIDRGDSETATACARQYIRYMMDLMFFVREWTDHVAQALIEEEMMDEEGWYGGPQMVDQAMALASQEKGSVFRPTHKHTLERIEADPKGEVEILFFFSMNSKHSRFMSPEVERLWRVVKNDPKVSMSALAIGNSPAELVESYREFTGMTVPILRGDDVAKELNVAFVPTVVVITKNGNKAYIKGGEQDFKKMYEIYRTAQGKDIQLTKKAEKLLDMPIGQLELMAKTGSTVAVATGAAKQRKKAKVARF